jgi:inward rectifier potassium channel
MAKAHRARRGIEMRLGGGSLVKAGAGSFDIRDMYHYATTASWPKFLAGVLMVELAINLIFALLYLLSPGAVTSARPGSLLDAFFFSLETLTTVGYGVMAPATLYGHVIVSLELLTGVMVTAVLTGMIFVRFARVRAKIAFADRAMVSRHNGMPTLMVRLGYIRSGSLVAAKADMYILLVGKTLEGKQYRSSYPLKLERDRLPLLVLTWALMHRIDETSPLFGFTSADLIAQGARLFVNMEAQNIDAGSAVIAFKGYSADQIMFGHVYSDMVQYDGMGSTRADMDLLSSYEAESALFTPAADDAEEEVSQAPV